MIRYLQLIFHPNAIQRKVKYCPMKYVTKEGHLTRLYVHLYITNAKQNIILTYAVPREQQNQAGVTTNRAARGMETSGKREKFCRSYQSLSSNARFEKNTQISVETFQVTSASASSASFPSASSYSYSSSSSYSSPPPSPLFSNTV